MNTVSERLQFVVDNFYNGNVTKFLEDNASISQPTFYRYLKGDKPSYDFLIEWNNIGYDIKWLLLGEGNMYANNNAGELKKIMVDKEMQRISMLRSGYITINEPKKDYNTLPDASGTYTNLEGNNQ